MPHPIEQTLAIITSPESKLRDISPIIYRLPNDLPAHETRMRYLDQTNCASRTMRLWLRMEYGSDWHMQTDQKDDSDVFALIREPKIRWWSGVRGWMNNLPWYAWWQNEQLMKKFFPHFNRFTMNQSQVLDVVKPKHLIKVDGDLDQRFTNFCRKHRLRQYGKLFWDKNHRHTSQQILEMENKGYSQLKSWLKNNKKWQDKLDAFLEPDYNWWKKVDMQE